MSPSPRDGFAPRVAVQLRVTPALRYEPFTVSTKFKTYVETCKAVPNPFTSCWNPEKLCKKLVEPTHRRH